MLNMLRPVLHGLVALAVLVGSVALAVVRGETPVESRSTEPATLASEHSTELDLEAPTNQPAQLWLGVIVPLEEVEVAAPVQARIETVHVRLGERVERDQVLVSIDARELDEDLAAARASLHALQASHAETKVESERADDQHRRTSVLGDIVAEQERSDAQLDSKVAAARVDRAAATITEQRALIAKLETARLDTEVRAPFSGIVSLRHVDAGAFTAEGAALIELVSHTRILRLAAPSPARVGLRLNVVCGDAGIRLAAIVERVAPQRDVASGMTLVEARLEGEDEVAIGEACEATPDTPD
jgi:multidrug efflux pump subunit AcrA (membrane-fusion protein)